MENETNTERKNWEKKNKFGVEMKTGSKTLEHKYTFIHPSLIPLTFATIYTQIPLHERIHTLTYVNIA